MISQSEYMNRFYGCQQTVAAAERKLWDMKQDYDAICRQIIMEYRRFAEDKVRESLSKTDVEALNKDKEGIRVSLLKENGYDNIYQLKGMSIERITDIKGIGEDSAAKIHKNVEKLYQNALSEVNFRIDYDNRDELMDNFIKLLYCAINAYPLIEEVNPFFISTQNKNGVALSNLQAGTGFFQWMFTAKSNKAYKEQELFDFEAYLKYEYIPQVKKCDSLYRLIRNTDVAVCWQEYIKNTIVYYNFLEKLIGNGRIRHGEANSLGLPKDLVNEIEGEILDLEYLNATLRSYQEFGTKYLIHQKRSLLGDEMGLGKTMQALAVIAHLKKKGKTRFLVVCPPSVLVNWVREIGKFTTIPVSEVYGDDCREEFEMWKTTGCVGVTTYEALRKIDFSEPGSLDLLVVDEAHYVKNPKAQRTINVQKLTDIAEYVIYMTGTPMENRMEEMKQLLSSINVAYEERLMEFNHMSSAKSFKDAIAPIYIRRVREDVLKELPDILEKEDWLAMNEEEKQAYRKSLSEDSYMRVRRLSWNIPDMTKSSKANRLLDICEEASADGRKVLVFSFFRDTVHYVSELLGDKCAGVITGDVSSAKRQQIIDEFEKSNSAYVLVAQIEAGGVGLNIQAASVVVFCEPQFKPSVENQAISRAYRMGQARNVLVHRLLMADTIDESIMDILKEKQKLFEKFADESAIGAEEFKMNENELMKNLIQKERQRLEILEGDLSKK